MSRSLPSLLLYQHFYLVGVKGVAMTAIAQCLLDAGKSVRGSDVAEKFVTQPILDQRHITIEESFEGGLPEGTDCVIYTSAHRSQDNPQVVAALAAGLPTFTHAEALGQLFNAHRGIAVCGVGGKSTTSAMITWILEKLGKKPNFAVGVGDIPGLGKTGQWRPDAEFFVAEADEYVTDPSAPSRGEEITPRFSFLQPFVTICTNMTHDHPDVYPTFADTLRHFSKFFDQIQDGGFLLMNAADQVKFAGMKFWDDAKGRQKVFFGTTENAAQLDPAQPAFLLDAATFTAENGKTSCVLRLPHLDQEITVTLQLPGLYNLHNAAAAVAACSCVGISPAEAAEALADFRSTLRRCEYIGEKQGVKFYDDYAHHPNEVKQVIYAYRQWFPQARLVTAFQSHTFSRTKQFFTEFIDAFSEADEVTMIDIFPSAREAFDPSVTSDQLCQEIQQKYPQIQAENYKTLDQLAVHLRATLKPGDVCLTIGAGDIYQVHTLIPLEDKEIELSKLQFEVMMTDQLKPLSFFSPRYNVELAPLTYFKIGGPAEVLIEAKSRDAVLSVARFCKLHDIKLTVLGGASNVVVSSAGLKGVVLITANEEYELTDEYVGEKRVVRGGAGSKTALFVRKTIDSGLTGLEYFLGVPGKIGGAVYNNAHYLLKLIGEHVHRVEVLTPDGEVRWLSHEECEFAYDMSRFHTSGEVILQIEFALAAGDKAQSMELIKEATLYRAKTQPLGEPSSGCFFRNTPNTEKLRQRFPQYASRSECPTAFLIDQLGLKGHTIGGIQVSHKHAAFLINIGGGTSEEVEQMVELVKQRVREEFEVELIPEVFLLK